MSDVSLPQAIFREFIHTDTMVMRKDLLIGAIQVNLENAAVFMPKPML